MTTLGKLLKEQRTQRNHNELVFAGMLGVSTHELARLENDQASVSNDRAEHWAELLKLSRVAVVKLNVLAKQQGLSQLVEPIDTYNRRTARG